MLLGSQSRHLGGTGTSFLEEVRCWHPSTCLNGDSQTDWGSVDPVVQGLFEKHFS